MVYMLIDHVSQSVYVYDGRTCDKAAAFRLTLVCTLVDAGGELGLPVGRLG